MDYKKTIMSVDAALGPCSVAIARGDEVLVSLREEEGQKSARELVPMIERALKEANLTYARLDAIMATVGPGTFTGLRIGLAAARGIGFATGKPVHGITTLAAAAYMSGEKKVMVVLNAGKGEVYYQPFESLNPMAEASLGLIEAASTAGLPLAENLKPGAAEAALAATAAPHLLLPPEPFYIRAPDCKPMPADV